MRPIRTSDGEAVAALIRRAFATNAGLPAPSALGVTAAAIQAHLEASGGAYEPGRGCVLWHTQAGGLHISRLAVDPAYRRQGMAQALLAAAEAHARHAGLARLTLSTRLALTANRAVFEQLGFRETGRSAHPGYDHPTMVDLAKSLGPAA